MTEQVMKEVSINPDYKTMWKVECELSEQLKQQLEEKDRMLNHLGKKNEQHIEAWKDAIEVIEELHDIVVGHIEEGDKLDSFTLQPAKQFLAKYREGGEMIPVTLSKNENEIKLEQELAKLKEENEKLKKMIDLGLGWEDLKREI